MGYSYLIVRKQRRKSNRRTGSGLIDLDTDLSGIGGRSFGAGIEDKEENSNKHCFQKAG